MVEKKYIQTTLITLSRSIANPKILGLRLNCFVAAVVLFLFFYYFSKIEFHKMKYAKNTAMTVERAKTKE